MEKATKEAKLHTSWINPNREYDRAVRYFIAAILQDDTSEFARQVQEFVAPVAYAGLFNSLSQVLLKIASPGVPDLYQGCEVWNWSLVDPDNRRPVDFPCLQRMLEGLRVASEQNRHAALVDELMRTPGDGRLKLFITSRALTYQRANRSLFETGKYIPLEASGRHRIHSVAFARRHRSQVTIAAAGRFFRKLKSDSTAPVGPGTWGDTALVLPKAAQRQAFRDIFTDRVVQGVSRDGFVVLPLDEVFSSMPVALLEGCD
jgi:(1->4)-alpha-D-glucan 1-alpha-D-glucosylmutase